MEEIIHHETGVIPCPWCGAQNEYASALPSNEDQRPPDAPDEEAASLSLCFDCGLISMFDRCEKGDLIIRKMTDEEDALLRADHDAMRVIGLYQEAIRKRKANDLKDSREA